MSNKSYSVFLSIFLLCFNTAVFAADEEEVPKEKPGYVSLGKKPMILNLATNGNRHVFLQIKADVLVKNEDAKEVIEAHIPAIRHKLILLLSEQNAIDMKTPAKREEIRKLATVEIRDMIEQMASNTDIEEVLFSNFLVQ